MMCQILSIFRSSTLLIIKTAVLKIELVMSNSETVALNDQKVLMTLKNHVKLLALGSRRLSAVIKILARFFNLTILNELVCHS